MLVVRLHVFRRHCPYGSANIDLIPGGPLELTRPCCGENQEFQRQLGRRACAPGGLDCRKALRQRVVRERGEVLRLEVPARRGGVGLDADRIVVAVPLRDGPTVDRGDPL